MPRLSPSRLILLIGTLAGAIVIADSPAQAPAGAPAATVEPKAVPGRPGEPDAIRTIRALMSNIEGNEKKRKEKQSLLFAASTATQKEGLSSEITALDNEIASLEVELESVATGIEVNQLDAQLEESIAFEEELREFFRPLIQEAKRATARPRELEKLRNEVAFSTKQRNMADKALKQIGDLLSQTDDGAIKDLLEAQANKWKVDRDKFNNQLITAQYQFREREANEADSLWSTLSSGVASFFRTRGKNIFIALASMAAMFSLLRLLHRNIERFSPFRKRGSSFGARLSDVLLYGITALLTICAGLAASYALGDWLLLGFSLILIAGFLWASKTAIPRVGEQVKLMLNLGPVREGERLVLGGVPWLVKKLSIYSRLTNPALEGGELRLPLRDLLPLSSRPFVPKEPFFPCEKGHWLVLADGTFGKVIRQTPEWVQLVLLGSSVKTFTTAEFLAQNPENLSPGFRLQQIFGIDYSHQKIATTEVPAILERHITSGLGELVGADNVVNVRVEFCNASTSSLDLAAIVDLAGSAAQKYNQAQRAIQRLCVDACNKHGWTIPFPQLTLHQAAAQ